MPTPTHYLLITLLQPLITSAQTFTLEYWDHPQYTGHNGIVNTNGSHNLNLWVKSYIWTSELEEPCCIIFCRDNVQIRATCDKLLTNVGLESAEEFNRVAVMCNHMPSYC